MRLMVVLLIYLSFLFGCKDSYEPIKPIEPTNPCGDSTKELKPVWQVSLISDSTRCVGSAIFSLNDKVATMVADQKNQRIMAYKVQVPTLVWQWIRTSDIRALYGKDLDNYQYKDRLLLCDSYSIPVLNTDNGNLITRPTIPTTKNGNGTPRISLINGKVYQGMADSNQFVGSNCFLLRLDLNSSKWDTVLEFKRKDHFGYMGGIEPPALHINNAKDSILMFKFRTIAPTGAPVSRLFFYAYNLTQKRVEWRKDSLDYDGSIYPPIIEGNRVYVDGLFSVYCLDANTGNIIWSKYVASRFQGSTGLFLYKDKIAGITLDGSFVCLDKETGNVVYQYKDDSRGQYDLASPSPAVQYNGVLYVMAGSYFYGLDIETGAMLGKYKSPNRCKYGSALFGYSGIAVNAQAGLVFVDDEYFLMAIKAFK